MKNNDILNVSGHLEICKVYADGKEETVFSDANTITSGMGVGLGLLYAGSGATNITDFQIRYFQLGVSGDTKIDDYGVFPTIPDNSIKRVDLNSVTYILYVARSACNNLETPLNEVGLFMQNPLGLATKRSQLCAYRPFTNITKTSDFALIFKWTLNF